MYLEEKTQFIYKRKTVEKIQQIILDFFKPPTEDRKDRVCILSVTLLRQVSKFGQTQLQMLRLQIVSKGQRKEGVWGQM